MRVKIANSFDELRKYESFFGKEFNASGELLKKINCEKFYHFKRKEIEFKTKLGLIKRK